MVLISVTNKSNNKIQETMIQLIKEGLVLQESCLYLCYNLHVDLL